MTTATQRPGLAAARTFSFKTGRTTHASHGVRSMRICKARSADLGNGLDLIIGVTFNFYIFGSTTATATAVTRAVEVATSPVTALSAPAVPGAARW